MSIQKESIFKEIYSMEQTIEAISSFFRSNISMKKFDDFYSIDMPMLDWNNDFVRFYMEEEDTGLIRVTDSRNTFESLRCDLRLDSTSLKKWEDTISAAIERFGATMDSNHEINMAFPSYKSGIGCFMFGQALSAASSAVGASVTVARQKTRREAFAKSFKSDLDKHLCNYTPDYKVQGKLLEYHYDFFVQGRQESLIRLLPEVNDDSKMLALLEWQDVIKIDDSPLYAIGKVEDKPKTSIGKKISKAMDENNIITLSYEKDKKAIEQYIMATA